MFNKRNKSETFIPPQPFVEFEELPAVDSDASITFIPEADSAVLESESLNSVQPQFESLSDSSGLPIISPTYGPKTTFGSVPWWSEKNWWKLAESGEGNDIRAHVGTTGDLAIAIGSVRGHKHRLGGAVNQDSYATQTVTLDDGQNFAVVVVCDGMGSAKYSSYGARLFAHNMAEIIALTIRSAPDEYQNVLQENQNETLKYVSDLVSSFRVGEFDAPPIRKKDLNILDIQCTMTYAIVPGFSEQRNESSRNATLGFIGDSPAFILHNDEWIRIDENKDDSGLWSSSTEGAIYAERMMMVEVEMSSGSALLLSSDGVGNYIRFEDQPTALGSDLARRWSQPIGMLDFIRDLSFETQSADDDRTAAVIWVDR